MSRFDLAPTGNMTLLRALQGEFPRAISLFRTSYSTVAVSRRDRPNALALLFVCQYAPDVASYTPVFVNGRGLARDWTSGSMHMYSPNSGESVSQ